MSRATIETMPEPPADWFPVGSRPERPQVDVTDTDRVVVELRPCKIAKHMSEETTAFTADIWADDVRVGYAKNDGHGGCTMYHILGSGKYSGSPELCALLERAAKALPARQYEFGLLAMDFEAVVDDLVAAHEEQAWIKRNSRTKTCFKLEGDPEDQWRTVPKHRWDAGTRRWLWSKYGTRVARVGACEIASPAFELTGLDAVRLPTD